MAISVGTTRVVIPINRYHRWVELAIQSVRTDEPDIPCSLVLDGVKHLDRTLLVQLSRNYNVDVVENSASGISAALNTVINTCREEFVARFDSDDVWMPGRLSHQLSLFAKDKNLAAVGGQMTIIDEEGNQIQRGFYPAYKKVCRLTSPYRAVVPHPGTTIKTAAIRSVGGYDSRFDGAEDFELWNRLLHRGWSITNTSEIVVSYRRHHAQVSTRRLEEQRELSSEITATYAGLLPKSIANRIFQLSTIPIRLKFRLQPLADSPI